MPATIGEKVSYLGRGIKCNRVGGAFDLRDMSWIVVPLDFQFEESVRLGDLGSNAVLMKMVSSEYTDW